LFYEAADPVPFFHRASPRQHDARSVSRFFSSRALAPGHSVGPG
jgi:hypothetical protein